jgi:3-methyladenine DNA glycosylase/8-oxoguanine DNA glycosylase
MNIARQGTHGHDDAMDMQAEGAIIAGSHVSMSAFGTIACRLYSNYGKQTPVTARLYKLGYSATRQMGTERFRFSR